MWALLSEGVVDATEEVVMSADKGKLPPPGGGSHSPGVSGNSDLIMPEQRRWEVGCGCGCRWACGCC